MKKIILLCCLLAIPITAHSYQGPGDLVGAALLASTTTIMNKLQTIAITLLSGFLLLQMVIDGYGLLASGEIEKVIAKLAKFMIWASFCAWLMRDAGTGDGLSNLGHFMRSTIDYFLTKASEWAGVNGGSFDSSDILSVGLVAYGKITIAVVKATTTNVVNAAAAVVLPQTTFITAIMVFFTSMVILACCAYISLKVFMVKLQVAIFICVSPLSVAMLGLTALREQGFAPLKGLLALIYRIIVLAAIVSAMKVVSDNLANVIDQQSWGVAADIWTPILASMFGFVLLAFITHQADGIASSLASGSATLSTGDMATSIAAAVAAGMAGGAAAKVVKSATGGQSMGDFIKSLNDGGSVSNETTGRGSAYELIQMDSPAKPSASMGGGAESDGGGNSAPQAKENGFSKRVVGDAVRAVGGSPEVQKAAADSAYMGESNEQVAGAVVAAGGTIEQGRAAAVARALSTVGAPEAMIKAGAEAAAAGKSPPEVSQAVTDSRVNGSSYGSEFERAATKAASTTPSAADRAATAPLQSELLTPPTRGTSAGIGGTQDHTPGETQEALKELGSRLGTLGHHLQQDKNTTHVSIDTRHHD